MLTRSDHIAVIVGLQAEARLLAPLHWDVMIGGGTTAGARAAARSAVAAGATALVSFGLAGGLDPALRPGTLLVPDSVLTEGERLLTDIALSARLGGPSPCCLLGSDRIAVAAGEKQHLFADTGAAAVDLESGAVARVAAEQGLPFGVLRAICDPAWRTLPAAALLALDSQGVIGIGRVLRSVLARPAQIPALLALGRDAAMARAALTRRVAAIAAAKSEGEGAA